MFLSFTTFLSTFIVQKPVHHFFFFFFFKPITNMSSGQTFLLAQYFRLTAEMTLSHCTDNFFVTVTVSVST